MIAKIAKNLDDRQISELEVDLKAMLETAIIYRMKKNAPPDGLKLLIKLNGF